jgi:hypothetical protein
MHKTINSIAKITVFLSKDGECYLEISTDGTGIIEYGMRGTVVGTSIKGENPCYAEIGGTTDSKFMRDLKDFLNYVFPNNSQ